VLFNAPPLLAALRKPLLPPEDYGIPVPPLVPAEAFEGIHAAGPFYAVDPAGGREWASDIATSAGSATLRWNRASAT
jgi:hypothetical protein